MTLPTWRRSNSVCVSTRTSPTNNPAPSTGSLIGQNWRSFYNASKPSVRHKTKCPKASWHKTRWRHWLPNSTVNCGHGPLSIQVPATVQAVLAARIDRLLPEEKQLLQTAAVIGTEVPLALLQAIAEVPEEALRLGLTHLQAAEFLYETRLFPDIEYTFKHALTQQVAYETLLQERRRALHARIVEALEALAGDRVAEQVERLAHHALRGEVWDKALAYFRQAGEKAMTRSAHREAVEYFEQALGALAHLSETRD